MDADEAIGRNVRRIRGERSQQSVAVSMTMLGGGRWDKSIVGKVELGKRSLKLSEAATLVGILGCTLDDLVKER